MRTEQFGPLRADFDGAMCSVEIANGPLNLVNGPLLMALRDLYDAFDAQGDDYSATRTVVAVFRSADPDFFLMHGDVEGIMAAPRRPYEPATEANFAAQAFERIARHRVIAIGCIDGAARGGGAEFFTALDLRIGSPRTVLGQPEVPMGILPGAGGTSRLAHLLGRAKALELILTARDVAADEALAIGWLDEVVARDHLVERCTALARRIAAMPPASVAAAKRVIDVSLRSGIGAALVAETDAYAQLTAREVHRAPMNRFLDVGGQTRDGEVGRMAAIIDATIAKG